MKYFVILIPILIFKINLVQGRFEFKNIICNAVAKDRVNFTACFLKSCSRNLKYLTFRAQLLKPLTTLQIRYDLLKRMNGYKPFLYNITHDACKFLSTPKGKRNAVINYVDGLFKDFSNIGHPCPYEGEVYVDKLTISSINHKVTKLLPFPIGEYALYVSAYVRNVVIAEVKIFGELTDF